MNTDDLPLNTENNARVLPDLHPAYNGPPQTSEEFIANRVYNVSGFDLICFEDNGTTAQIIGDSTNSKLNISIRYRDYPPREVSGQVCFDIPEEDHIISYRWQVDGAAKIPLMAGAQVRIHPGMRSYVTHKFTIERLMLGVILFLVVGAFMEWLGNGYRFVMDGW